jgi:hypothetical protein
VKKLLAFDWVVLAYVGIISAIILAARPPGAWIYQAYHALVLAMIALVIYAHTRYGGTFWTVPRYWYVVPVVLAAFRELHYLFPDVHPFNGRSRRSMPGGSGTSTASSWAPSPPSWSISSISATGSTSSP